MKRMTNFNYITQHLIPSWVQQWKINFNHWADLMTRNYKSYDNPWCESPERECYEWFWASINMDYTYSKKFLEDLIEMVDKIDSGETKMIPMDEALKIWEEDAQKYYGSDDYYETSGK